MSNLFGALDIKDSERPFTSVEGRQVVWSETLRIFEMWNQDAMDATKLFVQEDTDLHQERYELPGGGELEEEGFQGAMTAEANRGGSWDVAYPLKQFGRSLGYNEVALKYLTMGQYSAAIQTILNQNNNLVFRLILRAIFKNTTTAYTDPIYGSLTVQPLANGDSVVYPPVFGSTSEATENFYLAPNYSESTISDTNDPIATIVNALEPHYGFPQGGLPVVVLVNTTATAKLRALAAFDAVQYHNVVPGVNTAVPQDIAGEAPANGRVIGVAHGAAIVEWPRCPSGWMIGVPLDAPKALKRRIDPVALGLGNGLQMVTNAADGDDYPFVTARWRHRLGFGVGNRLGAVAVALNGTSSYSIPSGYS